MNDKLLVDTLDRFLKESKRRLEIIYRSRDEAIKAENYVDAGIFDSRIEGIEDVFYGLHHILSQSMETCHLQHNYELYTKYD